MNWQSRDDERVARALEGAPPPPGRDDLGVVALAERIRTVPADAGLDAAPAFRDALRARLMAEGAALLPHPRHPADAVPASPLDASPLEPGSLDPSSPDPGSPDPGLLESAPLGTGPHGTGPHGRSARAGGIRGEDAAAQRRGRHSSGPARGRAADRARHRRRRRAVVATVLAAATLSAGTVAASGSALPGDPLYGLKRRVQGVEVALARGDTDRGRRHLELARTRVRELGTAGASAAPGPLVATLDSMDAETRSGVRLLSTVAVRRTDQTRLTELDAWTVEQRMLLATTSLRLPGAARARASGSLALLGDVAARVTSLQTALRCDCPAAAPAATPADELGPLPCAGCAPTAPAPAAPPSGRTGTTTSPDAVPTEAASRSVPSGGPAPRTSVPLPGVPVQVPTEAPADGPEPAPRPPADATPSAPPPPEEPPVPTPEPTPEEPAPPVVPDNVVTDLLDGLLGAIGLGGP